MEGKGHRYSPVHSVELVAPAKMTKMKAFRILDLNETASLEEIQHKYDQVMKDHVENPLQSPHTAEDIAQLIAAKTFLDNIEKHKIKNPVTSTIANQHQQSQRAAKKYQQSCDTYFSKLDELLTRIDQINKTYLSPKGFIGKKMDVLHTQYKAEINALISEFKTMPQMLSSEVLRTLIRPLMMQNIFENMKDIKGGPHQVTQSELTRLKAEKETVSQTLHKMETGLRNLDKKIIGINEQFTQDILAVENLEGVNALQEKYLQTLRTNIMEPLDQTLGNDPEIIRIVTALTARLILRVEQIGGLHLRHQAFMSATENSTDPRIKEFLNQYHYYLQTLDQVVQNHPQFQEKFDQLSTDLYLLGSQYLLATLNPEVDREDLTKKLHAHIEKKIYHINKGFQNKDEGEKHLQWAQAWEILSPAVTDLFGDIHREKIVSVDPGQVAIDEFQVQYNRYLKELISLQKTFSIPEHAAVLQSLRPQLEEIGEDFFAKIQESDADIEKLCGDYKNLFNVAIGDAAYYFANAGGEKEELWPKLHPILQALATVIYFVRAYIKLSDAKIPERNLIFKQEKLAFQNDYDNWLQDIPELNKVALAEARSRLRKD